MPTLKERKISPSLITFFPPFLAEKYRAIPLQKNQHSLLIGVSTLLTSSKLEELCFVLECSIKQLIVPEQEIEQLLQQYYGIENKSTASFSKQPSLSVDLSEQSTFSATEEVNNLLRYAIETKASDLHLESFENHTLIRYRINGALQEKKIVSRNHIFSIISRLKFLANIDIAERRLPQDGRLQYTIDSVTVDFRLSTLPTQFGESVVLRVLDRRTMFPSLASLEMPPVIYEDVKKRIAQPHGLFLVVGPTGAGKTTTLYSCLQELNNQSQKILTVEDPIEYEIEGVIQTSVLDSIDRNFQYLLHSFLRHDPDIIMIGETRDEETARTAIQASLTGHLVLTSLHAHDTTSAVIRLRNMGIESTLIATTLTAILAQRLIRTICPKCKIPYSPDKTLLFELGFSEQSNPLFYYGQGCQDCNQTGYHGRQAIFELLSMNDSLRLLIIQGASQEQLQKKALAGKMKTLSHHGMQLVLTGITTIEEIQNL